MLAKSWYYTARRRHNNRSIQSFLSSVIPFLATASSIVSTATFGTARTTSTPITAFSMSTTTTALSASSSSSSSPSPFDRLVYGKNDALFGCIEEQQGTKPYGSFLDAGTGLHSLRWIATLVHNKQTTGLTDYAAITADTTMQRNVQLESEALEISGHGRVIVGNWFPAPNTDSSNVVPIDETEELRNQRYDTILADYLIGALDGFSPYKQDTMISKLVKLLKPNGRLYIVGLQPIPDTASGDANIICKVRQVRDACILLAGHRCYREYPVDWIIRQIENQNHNQPQAQAQPPPQQQTSENDNDDSTDSNEDSDCCRLQVLTTSRFPILYRHATIVKQINVGRSKFQYFPTPELATSMGKVLDDLEQQSLDATNRAPTGRIQLGFDYVVTAEKVRRISITTDKIQGDAKVE